MFYNHKNQNFCSLALDLQPQFGYNSKQTFDNSNFNRHSNKSFSKISSNLANMLGPAIICLPFVLQKSGLIFTLITISFLSLFSIFSSMCLIEAEKLSHLSRENQRSGVNYTVLIDKLIKDKIFAYSSKFCVILSHLIYSILCIITLTKLTGIFIIQNISVVKNINSESNGSAFNFIQGIRSLPSIYNNEHVLILLLCFSTFFVFFTIYQSKTVRKLLNISILIMTFTLTVWLIYYNVCLVSYKISGVGANSLMITNLIDLIGSDYTYLYGTILFSFSYVSAVPIWNEHDKDECTQQKNTVSYSLRNVLTISSFLGIVFKIFFAITFACLIQFDSEFSMHKYLSISSDISENLTLFKLLMTIMTFMLAISLFNAIATHTTLFYICIKSEYKIDLLLLFMSVISPWIMSGLLIIRGNMFLNILNWSSIFLLGFANYILPLIIYIQAAYHLDNYEKNYKQSAILDFENFVRLKREEIGLTCFHEKNEKYDVVLIDNRNIYSYNYLGILIQNILGEIRIKTLNQNAEVNLEIKEKIVDLIYQIQGHYSIEHSFYNICGGLITSMSKMMFLFYFMIICLMFFMMFSIYASLYNFLINKYLVVNIFLQSS